MLFELSLLQLSDWISAQLIQQNNQRWIDQCIQSRKKTFIMLDETPVFLARVPLSGLWGQRFRFQPEQVKQGRPIIVFDEGKNDLDFEGLGDFDEGDRSE